MVRRGQVTGYMSIRTKATAEEIAAVEPLYRALNDGSCKKRVHKGLVVGKGWLGKLPAMPLRWRVRCVMAALLPFSPPRWSRPLPGGYRSPQPRW